MAKQRQTVVPGAPADAQVAAGDDMGAYDDPELPPIPHAEAEQVPDAQQLLNRIRVLEGKLAKQAAPSVQRGRDSREVVPMDAAMKQAAADVAAGKRPRPILTPEGWYCHPEMARIKVHGVE